MILFDLLCIVFTDHLFVLSEDGCQIHLNHTTGSVFQHLLHRFQGTGGVHAVFADLLQIAFQHIQYINCVFKIVLAHIVFLVLNIGLDVFHEPF